MMNRCMDNATCSCECGGTMVPKVGTVIRVNNGKVTYKGRLPFKDRYEPEEDVEHVIRLGKPIRTGVAKVRRCFKI